MKHFFFLLLLISFLSSCAVFNSGKSALPIHDQNEVFEGSSQGYKGLIDVQVHMNAGSITEIIVINSEEDRFVGGTAIESLIDTVIEHNSADVDVITGATVTSKGFLEAVNNAILKK
ncbi:MAG: FMN-binding protein [Treponema sp.]|nr:FMN-binding protein [Treponema sp.]MCL2272535.1 FMN-binding protein [Treponema sp.]